MTITVAELQAQLIEHDQSVAANIVALVESVVDGRVGLADLDIDALQTKVESLNTLLDGDPNTEGYQAFVSLVNRLSTVEGVNETQATAITNLQTAVTELGARMTAAENRLDAIETAAEDYVTRTELANDSQLAGQAMINRMWQGRTRPAGLPNTDGSVSQ